ncbi:MAG TPA: hypothetical protein VFA70_01385 [Dehalococcoidia bacterium]|nr:hypothetical protein [Dehalococcoidia bacterium]
MKKLIAGLALPLVGAAALLASQAAPAFASARALNPADPRDFVQRNVSNVVLVAEYVSPSDEDAWGANWLTAGPLYPGEQGTLMFDYGAYPGECVFDIQVVTSNGDTYTNWGVNLCAGGVVMTFR